MEIEKQSRHSVRIALKSFMGVLRHPWNWRPIHYRLHYKIELDVNFFIENRRKSAI